MYYPIFVKLLCRYYFSFLELDSPKECKCAPGTNGKCPENIVPVFQCKEFIKEACPTETYEEATGNGCKNCAVLRHYCATTCNFCTPTGDPSEISEQ